MAAKNDITGDSITSKVNSDKFRSGYDNIDWSKKDESKSELQNLDIQDNSSTQTSNND